MLRTTPAIAAGVTDRLWEVPDLVALLEALERAAQNVRIVIWSRVARNLFILIFCATIAFLLGRGYHDSLRSGVLTVKGRTSRRDHDPISYWLGMFIGAFAFLILASATALIAFLICVDLFGR